ncbi:MAG TPA: hypothetical protein VLC07_04410 [Solirubrobacterales bacterium]|nr:hypothetical protein [Solirubrobacterales bacterium]
MANEPIIQRLLEHDARFDAIRSEMSQFRDEILTRFDQVMVILQRLDQERVFTNETNA